MPYRVLSRLNDGVYYLALGLWAGAIAMLAIGAPGAFFALRNAQPATDRADELAGLVVNRMVGGLLTLTLICAALVLVCVALQMLWHPEARKRTIANISRLALIAVACVMLAVVMWGIVPRMHEQREVMYDPSRSAVEQAQARDVFNNMHKASERLIGANGLAVALATLITPLAMSIESKDQGAGHG